MSDPKDSPDKFLAGLFTVDLKQDLVKALRDSEEDFRALVDLLPISLLVHRGGKILFANTGWLRLFGYETMEELIGKSPLSVVPPEDHAAVQARIDRVSSEKGSIRTQRQVFLKKDGERFHAEVEGVSVIHQGVPSVMVLVRDDSQRKKAEEALEGLQRNFKNMVEEMQDGILIGDGTRALYVNPSLVRMLGYERAEELVGKTPLELVPPKFHKVLLERIKSVSTEKITSRLLEYQWLRKDGTPLDVEVSSIPIEYEGKPRLMSVVRDITLRKRAEEALAQTNENFRLIVQEMPEGVLIHVGGTVVYANPALALMLGFEDPSQVEGRPIWDFVDPEIRAMADKRIDRILREGKANPVVRASMVGKDGLRVPTEGVSGPIVFDGKPAVIAVVRDMTQQRKIEEQAALNYKLATIGTLTAGIAHEISNPMTFVLANLKFLKDHLGKMTVRAAEWKPWDQEGWTLLTAMQKEVDDAYRGGERVRDIVRTFKGFSRTADERLEPVDLNEAIESAVIMGLHEIKSKARLKKELAPGLPPVLANAGKLQQVFLNLLLNAAQAIEKDGTKENLIGVRTGREGDSLFAQITDTGKGIPEEVLPRIFDPFFTTKPMGIGTGLGLYISADIVKRYQGTLEVQSREGVGTTFTLRLPIESAQPVLPGGRILVVDDDPDNLEVLERIFKDSYQVQTALSAPAALEMLGIGSTDVIVSDIYMPDMDGLEFHRIVAQKYPSLGKRFVFFTGGTLKSEMRDYLKTVSNPLLEKPFNFNALLQAVAQSKGEPGDRS